MGVRPAHCKITDMYTGVIIGVRQMAVASVKRERNGQAIIMHWNMDCKCQTSMFLPEF